MGQVLTDIQNHGLKGPNHSDVAFPADVSIAIVTHNGLKTLPACLQGVVETGCPLDRVKVYDVASTDGSAHWLADHHPDLRVVTLNDNRGPNPARNQAIQQSPTPYVLILDADVQLLPGTATELRHAIEEDDSAAIATPWVLYADRPDTVQYHRTFVHYLAEASADVGSHMDTVSKDPQSEPTRVGVASGCAPLIRVSAAKDAGLFELRYFFGKTDGEFAYRITTAGWHIVEPSAARVLHHHQERGGRYYTHQLRNRWHFMLKNYQLRTLLAILPVLLIHEPALFGLMLIKGKSAEYFRALGALCAWLPTLPADRRQVAATRRIHDWQILRGDALVIPGDIQRSAIGRWVSSYSRLLSLYWQAAHAVLKFVSKPFEGSTPRATATASPSTRNDKLSSDSSAHNHAA